MLSFARLSCACLAVTLTLGTVGSAHAAAELYTPLQLVGNEDILRCSIINVGTKARVVVIEVFTISGSRVTGSDVNVNPGAGNSLIVSGSQISTSSFCKFTVEGSKSQYRASSRVGNGQTDFVVVPAE